MYESLSNSQDVLFFARKEDVARTIIIDSLGISATNFNLTPADGEALRKSGLIAAQHYFAPIL